MAHPSRTAEPGEHPPGGRRHPKIAGDLCHESVFVDSDTRNRDVFDIFNADPSLQNVAVIGEGEVVGLINRDSYMRSMAKPYFKELYEKKRCVKFVDKAALVVEANTPILELADKLLNSSSKYRLSDGFVITQGQQLLGTGLTHDVLASVLAIERLQTEELARTNERLQELTITDPLTGLYNRRHFNEVVDAELKRAHRGRASVGLIMLDIDHFKKLNDTLGHQAGDEALQKVAAALKSCLRRPSDYCFRIGGEEFCVLTTDNSCDSAAAMAETLRSRVEALGLSNPGHPQRIVTVSVGVAISNGARDLAAEIYARADTALYKAKSTGRNKVVLSDIDCLEPDHHA